MASASNSNENIPEMGWKWDEVYQCFRFNGVLFPIPLNEKHPFEDVVRRERNLRRATRVESKIYSCHVFHCADMGKHVLVMNEVDTHNNTFYVLTPFEKDGKRKIKAKETDRLQIGELSPVAGEVYPDIDNRSNLTIAQRAQGTWLVQLRERNESQKMEKFYLHQSVQKTMRSMNEVATFILYNAIY